MPSKMATDRSPGRKPGVSRPLGFQPSKRAAEVSVAPTGLAVLLGLAYPGLTPGAINLPPALRARCPVLSMIGVLFDDH